MKIKLLSNIASSYLTASAGMIVNYDSIMAKDLIAGGYAEEVFENEEAVAVEKIDDVIEAEIKEMTEESTYEKATNQTILRRKTAKKAF